MKKLIIIISIMMSAYGIYTKEFNAVFNKAANICMECIGIG